jgi:endonuclease G, mitochondrial
VKQNRAIILLLLVVFILVLVIVLWKNKQNQSHVLKIKSLEQSYPDFQQGQLIKYTGFDLLYNEATEQPDWIIYLLTRKKLLHLPVARSNNFRQDKKIITGSAAPNDYYKTGFDRGHLAPAADMSWSGKAMKESFFMSNISPQRPGFNRGIWKKLENRVRKWTLQNDSLIVITGTIIPENHKKIGKNEVAVPDYFYKILLDISQKNGYKIIAFMLKNEASSADLFSYAINVDSLEVLTGIDFFYKLPAEIIEPLEKNTDVQAWKNPR